MSSSSKKRLLLSSGATLLLVALLLVSFLFRKENEVATNTSSDPSSHHRSTLGNPPIEGEVSKESVTESGKRQKEQEHKAPEAVVAAKPPRINGIEELLKMMRDDELRRTSVLGTWATGEAPSTCTCMAFLITPPSPEEYKRWQELASEVLSDPKKNSDEARKAINAVDKAFAFGDSPMYVKVTIPDQKGNQTSVMTGLIESQDSISHNNDGSVSVRHLKGFRLQTTDRISNGSRFGHLVDFGSTYGEEEVPE